MKEVILIGLLATMMGTSPVWAVDSVTVAPTVVATVQVQREATDALQVAVQGANAVRDVWFAHLTLFRGQPENARKLTDDAAALLVAGDVSWVKFMKADATAKMTADCYVMINATVALSEDYVVTPEKESAIKSANEKLAKDDQRGATDTPRLADIGMAESRYLMPPSQIRKAVAQVQKLLKVGKYYKMNLVLKGAEKGIVVDNETLAAGNRSPFHPDRAWGKRLTWVSL